ncbi:MAG: hypothetical protein ABIR11_11725, partial [Candidatus Limnocylindrales bacterium]
MNPRVPLIAALMFAQVSIGAIACSPAPEVVWLGGDDGGARLTRCPVADCKPIVGLARTSLDRASPGHAPIVRERLGEPACGPTVHTLCTYGGPLGIASRWAVVFDLQDGTTRIASVLCFEATND